VTVSVSETVDEDLAVNLPAVVTVSVRAVVVDAKV